MDSVPGAKVTVDEGRKWVLESEDSGHCQGYSVIKSDDMKCKAEIFGVKLVDDPLWDVHIFCGDFSSPNKQYQNVKFPNVISRKTLLFP